MISSRPFCSAVAWLAALALLTVHATALAETPQERVHRKSAHVMPFEMSKTVHVFRMTTFGGVQRVLVRDPADADQVPLIRRHLEREAERFGRGDYSDPAALHGADMAGLAVLEANPGKVEVTWSGLPAGARIRFETDDPEVLTAIHRWFGAQLSDHGADARAE